MDKQFFVKKEINDVLHSFRTGLINVPVDELGESSWIVKPFLNIVVMMIDYPELFDKYSGANIEWVGDNMIDRMRKFVNPVKGGFAGEIIIIFSFAYRFLCELEFMTPESFLVHAKSSEILNNIDEKIDSTQGLLKKQIVFARYFMPAQICKRFLTDHAINDYFKFNSQANEALRFIDEWKEDFEKQKEEIVELEKSAKRIASTFNFVGLVNGFEHLAKEKNKEKNWALWTLLGLVVLMVAPPIAQIFYIFGNMDLIAANKSVLLYALPAILAIEIMLIYLFRVVLVQFRSVKAQILQIELRKALCQFIESYTDYSMKIKEKDANALSKFEALVFSGLVPDNESIPSTFDGVEQLANLVKNIRG